MGSINAENGGAIVGEEKAGEWALGALLEMRLVICSMVDRYLESDQRAQ